MPPLAGATLLRDDAFTSGSGSTLAAVYTYGSPRVGDADFSDDLSTTRADAAGTGVYRFVDDKDPVPSVLVAWPWSHPGHKLASIFHPTSDSFIIHEEEDLVWLDVNGNAFYGADAQVRFDARWENLDPIVSDHTAYFAALASHAQK